MLSRDNGEVFEAACWGHIMSVQSGSSARGSHGNRNKQHIVSTLDNMATAIIHASGSWKQVCGCRFLILFPSNHNHKFKHEGRLDNLNICVFESLFTFALPCTTCWLTRTQCCIRQKVKLTKLNGYFMPSLMRNLWYGRLKDICCIVT